MAAEHYEMSGSVSDSLHDAVQASSMYNVYEPSDLTYYGISDSTAYQHLPSVTIDDIRTTVSDLLREDRAASIVKRERKETGEAFKAIGKRGEMVFSENDDGTYTHVVESGDTYWDVARTVLIAQTGEERPDSADIQKMMNKLQRYNGKPTSGEAANRLAIGEEIHIPRYISDLVEKRQDGHESAETSDESDDETSEGKKLTAREKRELTRTDNGIAADKSLMPRDGDYNPFQPPGLEPGRTEDYTMEGYWNYDVEGRKTLSDFTNEKTGERKLSYSGQVDSGYGANGIWWNDTAYDASETISANGVVTHRDITYYDSSVKMNFSDGHGNKVDAYVSYVESNLDPSSGNYRTQINTVDGRIYFMQIDGQTGQVIRNSIRSE